MRSRAVGASRGVHVVVADAQRIPGRRRDEVRVQQEARQVRLEDAPVDGRAPAVIREQAVGRLDPPVVLEMEPADMLDDGVGALGLGTLQRHLVTDVLRVGRADQRECGELGGRVEEVHRPLLERPHPLVKVRASAEADLPKVRLGEVVARRGPNGRPRDDQPRAESGDMHRAARRRPRPPDVRTRALPQVGSRGLRGAPHALKLPGVAVRWTNPKRGWTSRTSLVPTGCTSLPRDAPLRRSALHRVPSVASSSWYGSLAHLPRSPRAATRPGHRPRRPRRVGGGRSP